MSPAWNTTVPCALPSFGKVWMWPPPQWSKWPALVGVAPLRHHRVLAACVAEVGPAIAGDAHGFRFPIQSFGVFAGFLEARRRHELLQVVGRIDDHQHARAAVEHLLQPFGEQRHVEDHQRSAACTASSVPLHWPIVGTPTLVHEGSEFTHSS